MIASINSALISPFKKSGLISMAFSFHVFKSNNCQIVKEWITDNWKYQAM
jgi:hypothetical protein